MICHLYEVGSLPHGAKICMQNTTGITRHFCTPTVQDIMRQKFREKPFTHTNKWMLTKET